MLMNFCVLHEQDRSDFGYTHITDKVIAGFSFANSFTTITRLRYSTWTAVFNPNVKKRVKKNTVAQTERKDIIQLEALDKVQEEEEEEGETREPLNKKRNL